MIAWALLYKVFLLLFYQILFIGKDSLLTGSGYIYSMIALGFIGLFALITSIKYAILRSNLQSESKLKKYILSIITIIITIIVLNLIFIYGPKYYKIQEWYVTRKTADFLFIPITYKDKLDVNIRKMTIIESTFSLALVILEFSREKIKNNKIKYVLERILKFCFRYNLIFTFFIYTFTISSKYLMVGVAKTVGVALFSITAVILAIRYYLAIRSVKEKNEQKDGKENLIVVLTLANCKFCLGDDYRNPLHIFKKYNSQNLVKSLIVRGKDYTFVSYDAIRYNFIKQEQYKNIAYLININTNHFVAKSNQTYLLKKIEELEKEDKKIIITESSGWLRNDDVPYIDLKEKYKFRYKQNINAKDVLYMAKLDKNNDIFKQKCQKILENIYNNEIEIYIEKVFGEKLTREEVLSEDFVKRRKDLNLKDFILIEYIRTYVDIPAKNDVKNTYIKYALNDILGTFNYVEYFYDLLKIGEYITHYMGLKAFLDNPDETIKKIGIRDFRSGFLSTWRKCINVDVEYSINNTEKIYSLVSEADVINSLNRFRELIPKKNKEFKAESFKYGVCQILADIRNNLVAHGVVTYDLAKDVIDDLFNIVFIAIKEFENLDISIKEDEQIKNIFKQEFKIAYKEKNKLYLYSMSNYDKKEKVDLYQEYLNYETGKRKTTKKDIKLKMNLRYLDEDIEKEIGKRAIK